MFPFQCPSSCSSHSSNWFGGGKRCKGLGSGGKNASQKAKMGGRHWLPTSGLCLPLPKMLSQKVVGNTRHFVLEFMEFSFCQTHMWGLLGEERSPLSQTHGNCLAAPTEKSLPGFWGRKGGAQGHEVLSPCTAKCCVSEESQTQT